MEDIDRLARLTVGRVCVYAVVGIAAVMAAFGYSPALAFHAGGILSLSLALVLLLKASTMESAPPVRRDAGDLPRDLTPLLEHNLRALVTGALRNAYFTFASRASAAAVALLCISLALSLFLKAA